MAIQEGQPDEGDETMDVAVIMSTYNSTDVLRRCLLGFVAQTHQDFEMIIADDGSDSSTVEVFNDPALASLKIKHVWHEDFGFRKSKILNKAIARTSADYVIFCDGDCIPRKDFVAKHLKHARPGYFIAGARVDVHKRVHSRFEDKDIIENRIFDMDYLIHADASMERFKYRFMQDSPWEGLLNLLTYRYCVFHGCNASAWRKDLLAVNGFDETFGAYGSEDRDLGVRLRNSGVRSKFLKFSLVQIHQGHSRPYADQKSIVSNRRRFKARFFNGITRAESGLDSASHG